MSVPYKVNEDSIATRNRANQIIQEARKNGYTTVDLSGVEFVSRSVADELAHHKAESDIELQGLQDSVEAFVRAVGDRTEISAD